MASDKPVETIVVDEIPDLPPAPVRVPGKPGRPKKDKEALSSFTADGELIDIWERRMIHPQQKETKPIRITRPGMHLRWINLTNTARYQRARYEQGWMPVTRDILKDEREIYGATYTAEGYVCRGEKQSEMLMMIPEAVFQKIQKAKMDLVEKSRKHIKENMQAAGAQHFSDKYNSNTGHQIADTMSTFKGNVSFGSEAVMPDTDELDAVQAGLDG